MTPLDPNSYSRKQEKCACGFQFQNHIHESENLCALARAIFGRRELSVATVGMTHALALTRNLLRHPFLEVVNFSLRFFPQLLFAVFAHARELVVP